MPEAVHAQQPEITVALADPERGPLSPQDASFKAKSISRALRRAANKSRAPTSVIAGGGGFQARRGDRAFRLGVLASFAAFVIAPFLVASIYWGLIASKQYVTETKFALRAGEASSLDLLSGGAMGSQASQQMQDAQVLVNFIRSRSMIEALDRKVGLRAMFSRSGVDYFSSFDPEDSVEELEKYWKRRIDASLDMMSGIISVNVRAFTPRDSLTIAQNVTDLSERLVNELSTRSRRDALAQARTELTRAEEQLKNATGSMRDARNTEGVLDAPAAAEAINKLITTLRLELAATQEDLALHSDSATSDSPQARLLTARVQSLKSQIDEYSTQIAGGGERGEGSLAQRAGVLSMHQIELDLARQRYALAASMFENARVDLETQRAYLVSFLRPTLAEKSLYPRRWIEWGIIVAPATIGWLALVAVAFLVRDHMAK
jgi:capsular polysaccharide transport system permease protein